MIKNLPPSFRQLKSMAQIQGWDKGHATLTISRTGLTELLKPFLEWVDFDEAWYLKTYPDVAAAVATKQVSSAFDHYVNFG